jgi:hypothetical protein
MTDRWVRMGMEDLAITCACNVVRNRVGITEASLDSLQMPGLDAGP